MTNDVVDFLKAEASENNYTIFDAIYGEVCLNESKPIKQSSGAVYGIFVSSEEPIENVSELNGYPKLYPVYWGKDIAPVSRLKAHVKNYKNTGNVDLPNITEIKEKKIIFGAIMVSEYQKFEQYLHSSYPPLRGTNRPGKISQIIDILN